VIAADLGCAMVFAPLMRQLRPMLLEVPSHLPGILPSAVGVDLFPQGLVALRVHVGPAH